MTPTSKEINAVLNQCDEQENAGTSLYPGMTYEQGVAAAIKWMEGNEPNPMED